MENSGDDREMMIVTEEDGKTILAGAKLARFLTYKERISVGIEADSVYGAAVLLPQLARTTKWKNNDLIAMSVASYGYLGICICIHALLLVYVSKEERIMDQFAGQPYLCDFGADLEDVSQRGPGGTVMTEPRLYSWGQYATRVYVRDALLKMFPKQADEMPDPGEYGLESYNCRLLCVIVFIMSIMPEVWLCIKMWMLLWYTPTRSDPWIQLIDNSDNSESDDKSKPNTPVLTETFSENETSSVKPLMTAATKGDKPEDCIKQVTVTVAGMPLGWKIINFFVVVIPKTALVGMTGHAGVNFLMDTAGIDDIIVNSVALGFLLAIDELIACNLMSVAANDLIDRCEDYYVPGQSDDEGILSGEETIARYAAQGEDDLASCGTSCFASFKNLGQLFGRLEWQFRKLWIVAVLTTIMLYNYYEAHCELDDAGRQVSIETFLPNTVHYTLTQAFFHWVFPLNFANTTSWSMPEADD